MQTHCWWTARDFGSKTCIGTGTQRRYLLGDNVSEHKIKREISRALKIKKETTPPNNQRGENSQMNHKKIMKREKKKKKKDPRLCLYEGD